MNKNTLKKHVKNRIEEKREKLRASLNSITEVTQPVCLFNGDC